jgi:glycosyltransferase involved in cell wall biosynthesis
MNAVARLPAAGPAGPPLPIVCFSKDWNEDATCNHHVLAELARTRKVLWLNSIATRTPKLSSGRDLKKIARKVAAFTKGPVEVSPNLWVYTPLAVPLPHSPLAVAANRGILRATIGALRWKLGIRDFELWSFLPIAGHYTGLGESFLVYYCTDEYSLFSYVDENGTAAAERALVEKADVVFATCEALVERKRALNPVTHLAAHGVDHEKFARALAPETPVPADLAAIRPPVIGFYGTLQDWVDLELVAGLARRRPDWSIALVGQALVDLSPIARFPNVHVLGRRPHDALPAYCKGFAAGIIPYLIDERMKYVNPIKLREYLSAGLPVVSTPVPEVARYGEHCTIARTAAEFEAALEEAMAVDTPELRRRRSDAMRRETWPRKVAELQATIDLAKAERRGAAAGGRRVA